MISIQISFDEALLRRLDARPEVRDRGRSAVFREAVADFLERKEREEVARSYAEGYKGYGGSLDDFEGWEDEGVWTED